MILNSRDVAIESNFFVFSAWEKKRVSMNSDYKGGCLGSFMGLLEFVYMWDPREDKATLVEISHTVQKRRADTAKQRINTIYRIHS